MRVLLLFSLFQRQHIHIKTLCKFNGVPLSMFSTNFCRCRRFSGFRAFKNLRARQSAFPFALSFAEWFVSPTCQCILHLVYFGYIIRGTLKAYATQEGYTTEAISHIAPRFFGFENINYTVYYRLS